MLRTRICWPLPATQIKSRCVAPGCECPVSCKKPLVWCNLVLGFSAFGRCATCRKDQPIAGRLRARQRRPWFGATWCSRSAHLEGAPHVTDCPIVGRVGCEAERETSPVACHVALLVQPPVDFSSTFSFLFDANCPSGLEAVPLPRSPKPSVMTNVVPHSPP
jgi:hypothetical protein